MTDRHTADNRHDRSDRSTNAVPWLNVEGASIPAFGVVQLKANFSTISQASKPTGGSGLFYTNGPVEVATSAKGESFLWNKPQSVLISTTVVVGDEVGPVSGSWEMSAEGTGYRVLRQPGSGVAVVERVGGGGGGGGGNSILFTIVTATCDPYSGLITSVMVTVDDYTGGCDKRPPDMNSYDQIEVHDRCGTLAFFTESQLVGATGRATYFYPWGAASGYCIPKWRVDDICQVLECV